MQPTQANGSHLRLLQFSRTEFPLFSNMGKTAPIWAAPYRRSPFVTNGKKFGSYAQGSKKKAKRIPNTGTNNKTVPTRKVVQQLLGEDLCTRKHPLTPTHVQIVAPGRLSETIVPTRPRGR